MQSSSNMILINIQFLANFEMSSTIFLPTLLKLRNDSSNNLSLVTFVMVKMSFLRVTLPLIFHSSYIALITKIALDKTRKTQSLNKPNPPRQ